MPGADGKRVFNRHVCREQDNPLTDLLQKSNTTPVKIETIEKGSDATMRIWDALKQNRVVGMLVDQDERKRESLLIFSVRLLPAIPRGSLSSDATKSSSTFHQPLHPKPDRVRFERVHFQKTGNQEDDLKKLTQKMLAGLEKMIRRHPEQYFWMHKRWRTRPQDDSSSPY